MLYPKLDRFEMYHRQTDEARNCLVVENFITLATEKMTPMWQIYLPKSYIQFLVKAFLFSFFIFKWYYIIIAINKKYFSNLFYYFFTQF